VRVSTFLACAALCTAVLGVPRQTAASALRGPDLPAQVAPVQETGPDLTVRAPPSRWRRSAGQTLLTAGSLLLAGGLTLSLVSRQLAGDLRARSAALPLGPDGLAEYRRLESLNAATAGLCIAGGVAATLGAWLWLTAPELNTDFQPVRGGFLVQYRGKF
jgi:hypothetical protein